MALRRQQMFMSAPAIWFVVVMITLILPIVLAR